MLKSPKFKFFIAIFIILLIAFLIFALSVFKAFKNIDKKQASGEALINTYDFSQKNLEVYNIVVTSDDPSIGPDNAQLVIVEFSDFKCPHCEQMFSTMRRLSVEYKDRVKFIFRDFPVVTDVSGDFAMASECADEQGQFWEFHDKVYSDPSVTLLGISNVVRSLSIDAKKFNDCVMSEKYLLEVQNDLLEGSKAGVMGTPTFFINGHKIQGTIPYDMFKNIIDTTLAKISEK